MAVFEAYPADVDAHYPGLGIDIGLGGGLHPVRGVAEVDEVQVVLEDLALGQLLLELDREHRLPRFRGEVALAADAKRVLHQLLRDR